MKIKVAQYIADFLVEKGVEHIFTVTGGGAMHLNDAFGHKAGLCCVYNHHEQACAIAAEGYTRDCGKIAAVCVTSGPGGTNALTGVLGGWLDSVPMFVISGQVKRETTLQASDVPLRQLGDQEFNIVDCVSVMTKYAVMVNEPEKIRYYMEKAWFLCRNGRGGPVWLDVPLDVQASVIETDELEGFCEEELLKQEKPVYDQKMTDRILEEIRKAKRPLIFAGTAIRLADAHKEFMECVEALKLPVVTAWNAHDVLNDDHPYFCGRPGTVGTRGGNFAVQNSDLLLVLGSRLNIRLVSYNYKDFAKDALKIIVDIDANELRKPTVTPDIAVHADVKDVMSDLAAKGRGNAGCHEEWLRWCRDTNAKYPACLPAYLETNTPLNPYAFIRKFFEGLSEGDKIVCGNGSACVITFQAAVIKKNQRLFTNSGCAAMGYGFPAAIGVCMENKGKRVICIDGDGSFQMNIQELQTVAYHQLNLKLFILNNNGYHSIRQTQTNLFKPPLVGVCDGNGLSFPSLEKIAYAYDISYEKISALCEVDEKTRAVLNRQGPVICEVVVDPAQNFEPKLSSKVLPDGKIVSPPLDDMFPFLPKEEYEKNKEVKGVSG